MVGCSETKDTPTDRLCPIRNEINMYASQANELSEEEFVYKQDEVNDLLVTVGALLEGLAIDLHEHSPNNQKIKKAHELVYSIRGLQL